MARRRSDNKTLELLDWQPPAVAETFTPERVRGHTDRIRMGRAYAEAMKDSDQSRDDIHADMIAHLGFTFGRHAFDRCTAASAEGHEFTVSKLIAFLHAVPDIRVVNELLDGTGFAAVPEKYLSAIEEAICDDQIEQFTERKRLARRNWRGRS